MYKLKYHLEVQNDLDKLPLNVLQEALEYLKKYKKEPYKYSTKLHTQGGLNLEGYRKTYIADATYRIVFKIEDDITKIVEIVAVGKRDKKEVYFEAFDRIK